MKSCWSPAVAPGAGCKAAQVDVQREEYGPVRTVTRREIVPGTYGRVKVTGTYSGDRVTLKWVDSGNINSAVHIVGLNPEELRESAHILNQLAEALEDKP